MRPIPATGRCRRTPARGASSTMRTRHAGMSPTEGVPELTDCYLGSAPRASPEGRSALRNRGETLTDAERRQRSRASERAGERGTSSESERTAAARVLELAYAAEEASAGKGRQGRGKIGERFNEARTAKEPAGKGRQSEGRIAEQFDGVRTAKKWKDSSTGLARRGDGRQWADVDEDDMGCAECAAEWSKLTSDRGVASLSLGNESHLDWESVDHLRFSCMRGCMSDCVNWFSDECTECASWLSDDWLSSGHQNRNGPSCTDRALKPDQSHEFGNCMISSPPAWFTFSPPPRRVCVEGGALSVTTSEAGGGHFYTCMYILSCGYFPSGLKPIVGVLFHRDSL